MTIEAVTRSVGYAMYKDDYESVDGVEDATFTKADGLTVVTGVKAKVEQWSHGQKQVGQGVGLESTEVAVTIWDTTLDGQTVETADRLTIGSTTYTLGGNIRKLHWDTQWQCSGTEEATTL